MTEGSIGRGCAGEFCISPGMRKFAGETLCEAFIPLQPVPSMLAETTKVASRTEFQLNRILSV